MSAYGDRTHGRGISLSRNFLSRICLRCGVLLACCSLAARLLLACCSLAHLARHRLRAYLLRTGAPSSSIGCVSMSLYDGLTLTFIVVPSSNIGGFVEPTTSATIFSNTLAIVGSYFSSACTVFTCSVGCPPVFVCFVLFLLLLERLMLLDAYALCPVGGFA